MSYLKILLVPVFLHLGIACAQDATGAGQMRSHECSEFYRSEGWTVPGLKGAKASGEQSPPEAKSEIRLKVLKPAQVEGALTLVRCPADSPGRVEVDEVPVKVLQLLAYEYAGSLFAYRVSFTQETSLADGTRTETGGESAVFFIDLDGTGRFKLMKPPSSLRELYAPPVVPDWVRRSAAERQPH
jgi:hypothetical protein